MAEGFATIAGRRRRSDSRTRPPRRRGQFALPSILLAASALSGHAADRVINGADERIDTGTVSYDRLLVGGIANASLSILTSAEVTTTNAALGENAGVSGTVYLRGGGSVWTNTDALAVGDGGTGVIEVGEGATLDTHDTTLGSQAGSSGRATVSGGGTRWESSGTLTVGGSGSGHLRVEAGGAVEPFKMTLADALGSDGTVEVAGGGSRLTATGTTTIGNAGRGEMTVSGGGSAEMEDTVLGAQATGEGTVTVTGGGSSWTSNGALTVGDAGAGAFTVSAGGSAEIGDATLGASAGGTGRAVATGGGSTFTSTGALTVGGNGTGTFDVEAGGSAEIASATLGAGADGDGTVNVTGGGSTWSSTGDLTVGGAGTGRFNVAAGGAATAAALTIGAEAGSSGTVVATGGGSSLTIEGPLVIGDEGAGTLIVDGGASVTAEGTVTIAAEAGSTGTLAIGGMPGGTTISAGAFAADAVTFGAGDGAIVFNHPEDLHVFSAAISGDGTIRAEAGTTLLDADNSGFTGETGIVDATLLIEGALGGDVAVGAGGTFGGNTADGDAVGGDITFAEGSTYRVTARSGAMTAIDAGGLVTIADGTLLDVVLDTPGRFAAGDSFTILTAAGGITGAFELPDERLTAFLALELDPGANEIALDVVQDRAFVTAARTRNQIAVATAADTLPADGDLFGAVLNLPDEAAARDAFDMLSGAVHGSVAGMLVDDSRFIRDAATERLRIMFADAPSTDGMTIWGQGYGAWGETRDDGNAAPLSRTTGGFIAGIEAPIEDWRLGALFGYGGTAFDASDENASGDVDSFQIGLYGGTAWGPVGLRLGAAFGHHEIETTRRITLPAFTETARADYGADGLQAFAELGYAIKAGAVAFEPFIGLAAVTLSTDDFAEEGGEASLSGSADADVLFSTIGLRAAADLALAGHDATIDGMVGWRHAAGDLAAPATFAFSGSDPFTVYGAPVAADTLLAHARVKLALGARTAVALAYGMQFDGDALDQSLEARLSFDF